MVQTLRNPIIVLLEGLPHDLRCLESVSDLKMSCRDIRNKLIHQHCGPEFPILPDIRLLSTPRLGEVIPLDHSPLSWCAKVRDLQRFHSTLLRAWRLERSS